jgi:hypothetical protein
VDTLKALLQLEMGTVIWIFQRTLLFDYMREYSFKNEHKNRS